MKRQLIFALPFVAIMGVANAQVTAIGPFVGDESDSFETQTAFSFDQCIIGRVFNNMGDLCTPGNSAHITSSWSFMCQIFPHSGGRLYGSAGGASTYTFDTPVQRFGGYFGTNSWSSPSQGTVTVDFFDSANNLIDSVVLTSFFGDCQWYWNGFEASGPIIKRVVVTNSLVGGGFIDMDDMEMSFTGSSSQACTDFELNAPCVFNGTVPLTNQIAGFVGSGPAALDGGAVLDQCGNFGINARSGLDFLAFNRLNTASVQMQNGGFPNDPETITFNAPVTAAEIWASGGTAFPNAAFRMDAFNGAALVDTDTVAPGPIWGQLSVAAANITHIVLTETTGATYFVYDDMCWSTSGSPPIGTYFECPQTVRNSTGLPGVITATGSTVVASNDVKLTASQLPHNQFGYFLNSMNQNPAGFMPPGSQGRLCIGPQGIGRHNQPGAIFNTMGTGMGSLQLDLTSVPTPSGNVAIQAGQTWYFTCWYRDNNPGSTSNFTDAVCLF